MRALIRTFDTIIHGTTMYRLLVTTLSALLALALLFSTLGSLPLSPIGLLLTYGSALASCLAAKLLFDRLYRAPSNHESALITGLILACIMPPVTSLAGVAGVILTGTIAIASKYILTYRQQHIVNPAAFGAFVIALTGLTHATWWIGNPTMLPFVAAAGLAILYKLRLWNLAVPFFTVALAVMVAVGLHYDTTPLSALIGAFTSWPLLFFAGFMLSEPATMPAGRRRRMAYGSLIGGLFAAQLSLGPIATTPETVLLVGNILFFLSAPKYRSRLTLKARHRNGDQYDLEFTSATPLRFKAGQYAEWTLPDRRTDNRGNRRTFTIASAPTESSVRVGVRHSSPSSAYKRDLLALKPGDSVWLGQVAGDFVLPHDKTVPLTFIAGGIGVTPFRSMVKYVADAHESRTMQLLYLVHDRDEVLYADIWKEAANGGLDTRIILPKPAAAFAAITADSVREQSDYRNRRYYIAGSHSMVSATRHTLRQAGIPRRQIVTDYFSGY